MDPGKLRVGDFITIVEEYHTLRVARVVSIERYSVGRHKKKFFSADVIVAPGSIGISTIDAYEIEHFCTMSTKHEVEAWYVWASEELDFKYKIMAKLYKFAEEKLPCVKRIDTKTTKDSWVDGWRFDKDIWTTALSMRCESSEKFCRISSVFKEKRKTNGRRRSTASRKGS